MTDPGGAAAVTSRTGSRAVSDPEGLGPVVGRADDRAVADPEGLAALVVDPDPMPLADLLTADRRVSRVSVAPGLAAARRVVGAGGIDVAFCGLGSAGLELPRALGRVSDPPLLVLVAEHGQWALEAFDLGAVDYLLNPPNADRLAETLRRVRAARDRRVADEPIPVDLGGRTVLVRRSEVRWVRAHGDYARLHTVDGSHLIRVPLAVLAERWADAGFIRVHRSYLVALPLAKELRAAHGGYVLRVGDSDVPVSRRHLKTVRAALRRSIR